MGPSPILTCNIHWQSFQPRPWKAAAKLSLNHPQELPAAPHLPPHLHYLPDNKRQTVLQTPSGSHQLQTSHVSFIAKTEREAWDSAVLSFWHVLVNELLKSKECGGILARSMKWNEMKWKRTLIISELFQAEVDDTCSETKPNQTDGSLSLRGEGTKTEEKLTCILISHSTSNFSRVFLTCCLLRRTWARCFPTAAERLRQTPQGLSITLATASREAGHVRAVNMPEKEEPDKQQYRWAAY